MTTETATSNYVFHDLKPMKMKDIDQLKSVSEEDLIDDDQWVLQQKMDGTRAFIKIKYDEHMDTWDFTWLSSNGSPLKHAAAKLHFGKVEQALVDDHLYGRIEGEGDWLSKFTVLEAVLDAELIIETGELYIFDLPWLRTRLDGDDRLQVSPETPALSRLVRIEDILHAYPESGTVRTLPVWRGAREKAEALLRLSTRGVEGGVFKHIYGEYALDPKKRTREQLKLKFVKDADVVVLERNRGGTENAILGVLDPLPHQGAVMKEIGSCSMIGKADAQPGDVITVQYLYWTGVSMIQPRMTRIREDKTADECFVDQFPTYSREAVR